MTLFKNYQLLYIFQKKEKKEEKTSSKLLDETKLITKIVARFKYKKSKSIKI